MRLQHMDNSEGPTLKDENYLNNDSLVSFRKKDACWTWIVSNKNKNRYFGYASDMLGRQAITVRK